MAMTLVTAGTLLVLDCAQQTKLAMDSNPHYNQKTGMDRAGLILGVFIGAAVGAFAAMLLAPNAGNKPADS